jgi:hypothetical protein
MNARVTTAAASGSNVSNRNQSHVELKRGNKSYGNVRGQQPKSDNNSQNFTSNTISGSSSTPVKKEPLKGLGLPNPITAGLTALAGTVGGNYMKQADYYDAIRYTAQNVPEARQLYKTFKSHGFTGRDNPYQSPLPQYIPKLHPADLRPMKFFFAGTAGVSAGVGTMMHEYSSRRNEFESKDRAISGKAGAEVMSNTIRSFGGAAVGTYAAIQTGQKRNGWAALAAGGAATTAFTAAYDALASKFIPTSKTGTSALVAAAN